MARPRSEGLEYFPVDVDMWEDDKFQLVIAKHGLVAEAVLIRLLMRLYRVGYCYRWTEKDKIIFASKVNLEVSAVETIVSDAINEGFFCQKLYSKYQILSSKGIQSRYKEACRKRVGGAKIKDEFNLLVLQKEQKTVSPTETTVEPEFLPPETPQAAEVSPDINTQSKVKESKVNKSKVNNRTEVHFGSDVLEVDNWVLEDPESLELLTDWIEQRKKSRKKVSQKALNLNLKDFENQHERFKLALRHTIKNDYQGIFEPKANGVGLTIVPKSIAEFRAKLEAVDNQ